LGNCKAAGENDYGKEGYRNNPLSAEAIKEMKQKAFAARDKLNLLPTYRLVSGDYLKWVPEKIL